MKKKTKYKEVCGVIPRATRSTLHDTGGFTLIETLVAIMILTVSIAGTLTIETKGI